MSKNYIFVNPKENSGEKKFRSFVKGLIQESYKKYEQKQKAETNFRNLLRSLLNEKASPLKIDVSGAGEQSFQDLPKIQDFSLGDFSSSEAPSDTPEIPEEENFEKDLNSIGNKKAEARFDASFNNQLENEYSDLGSSDKALFENWLFINIVLLLYTTHINGSGMAKGVKAMAPPAEGMEIDKERDATELFKTIDLTDLADYLEEKTAITEDDEGPLVEPSSFARDENGFKSAYNFIVDYLKKAPETPETTEETSESEDVQPTGITQLGEYFEGIKESIAKDYESLTSSYEERKSYIISLLNRVKLAFIDINKEDQLEAVER